MKKIYNLISVGIILLLSTAVSGQAPIVKVTTVWQNAPTTLNYTSMGATASSYSNTPLDYSFGLASQPTNNMKKLVDFTIDDKIYTYATNASMAIKLRRVNNAQVTGSRTLLWVERETSSSDKTVTVVNPYNDNMELAFTNNSLNQGTDNLFENQGDGNGNNNNIERLDVVFAGGILSSKNTQVGFALFERGVNNAHDGFVMAAITAIDMDGNPSAYGIPVRVSPSDYGNLPASETKYYVVRRDIDNEATLKMSTSGSQAIGGVFISLTNLGIANDTKIFGYSLFSSDLPETATPTDLVDYTNTEFFPTNTGADKGGIDLISLTGVLSISDAIILPPTAENVVVPAMLNTVSITAIKPLEATAATGTIYDYTITTVPTINQGTLYLCNNGNCTPVTAGQVLTPAEINHLSFQPNPAFTGNVVFYYYATDSQGQVSNTASYTIPVVQPAASTLPVKMINFSGSINNKSISLNWQTAQEVNSSYFEVQRSNTGTNFEPIATFTAQGFSNVTTSYTASDELFLYTEATVFYRLKMIDIDGRFTYSAVLSFKVNGTLTTTISVFPNPFRDNISTRLLSDQNGVVKIKITSLDGRMLSNSNKMVSKGQNILPVTEVQNLPAGTYIMSVILGGKAENIKIVKQ